MFKKSDMKNVGVKQKDNEVCCAPSIDKGETRIDYPDMYLNSKQLKEIEGVITGEFYTIHAYVKIKRKDEDEVVKNGKVEKRCNATLEVHQMALKPGKNPAEGKAQRKKMGADIAQKRLSNKKGGKRYGY